MANGRRWEMRSKKNSLKGINGRERNFLLNLPGRKRGLIVFLKRKWVRGYRNRCFTEQESDGSVTVGTNHDSIKLLRWSGTRTVSDGRCVRRLFVPWRRRTRRRRGRRMERAATRCEYANMRRQQRPAADNDSDFRWNLNFIENNTQIELPQSR